MKKVIYTCTLYWLFYACTPDASRLDQNQHNPNNHLPKKAYKPKVVTKSRKVDSIDQANNESVLQSGDDITRAIVFLSEGDSTIYLTSNSQKDHRMFGYASPNVSSKRLLLLSVFTNDVEQNPFDLKLGAYYDTNRMTDLTLKYFSEQGAFIKAVASDSQNNKNIVYFDKKWIDLK